MNFKIRNFNSYLNRKEFSVLSEGPKLAIRIKDKIVFSVIKLCLNSSLKGKDRLALYLKKNSWNTTIKPAGFNGNIYMDVFSHSHNLIYDEIFVENVYDLDKLDFVPDLIIDCGAHIGLFSVLANNYFTTRNSFAFEPNSENLVYLKQNCVLNKLSTQIIPNAVSNYAGVGNFFASVSHGGSINNSGDDQTTKINVTNLSDFLSHRTEANLLLKIDIEGEEQVVFPDIMKYLPDKCAIFFETHHDLDSFEKIAHLLKENGFLVELVRQRDIYCDGFAQR